MSSRLDTAFHADAGKSRVDLIDPGFLLGVGTVLDYGAAKYGPRNWEKYADQWEYTQLMGSALRHLYAFQDRQDFDDESGIHHLLHAATNLMMLYSLVRNGRGRDDRTCLSTETVSLTQLHLPF